MIFSRYTGRFEKEVIRKKALNFLSDPWNVIDQDDDLFLERKGSPLIRGVRLKFYPDRVEATLRLKHSFYLLVSLAIVVMVLLARGEKRLQDLALISLGGGIFYFVVTYRVQKELRKIFP